MISLPQLLRPVDGVDVDPKRILAQAIGIARRVDHDGEDLVQRSVALRLPFS
jgi:hypothetical protein